MREMLRRGEPDPAAAAGRFVGAQYHLDADATIGGACQWPALSLQIVDQWARHVADAVTMGPQGGNRRPPMRPSPGDTA